MFGIFMEKSDGFSGMFGDSWNMLWDRFGLLASLGLLLSFLPGIVFALWDRSRFQYMVEGVAPTAADIAMEFKVLSPWLLVLSLFSILLTVCVVYSLNAGTKKKTVGFNSAFNGGIKFYGKALLLEILLLVFLIPLYLLLIIPGIIFQVYWTFALYILVAENGSIMGSIKRSYDIVKGRWWKVAGYLLLFYVIVGVFGSVASGVFSLLGIVGIFLDTAVMTVISIFGLIFINTFYLSLAKPNKISFREKNKKRLKKKK